mgnify:CR=1 FL=1
MIQILDDLNKKMEQSVMKNESDYIKNGLLYCGKCNTAKQCEVEILNQKKKFYCLCKCETIKRDNEIKRQEELEEIRRIERLKTQGLQDKEALNWNFEKAESNKYIEKAKIYCNNWNEMYKNNIGLIFWGDVGTGKTYVAGCIANYLLDKKIPVLMTNFSKIINDMMGFKISNKNEYLEELNRYKLLIIDDLGAERQSEFALEQVFSIIDNRYKNGQPIIITTNLSLQEIKEPSNITYKRIYDRVLEMCTPMKFIGESKRRLQASKKIENLKKMMEG